VAIPSTPAESDAFAAKMGDLAHRCGAVMGPLLSHISTADTVRHLDALRAAVGEDTITYVGLSYGTVIGQMYAGRPADGRAAPGPAVGSDQGPIGVRRAALGRAGPRARGHRAALQGLVDTTVQKLHVSGAVALLKTPQGTFTAVAGTTDLGTQTPPSADTHFRIASNTKTMTSAVVLRLAQEGRLKLNDPVARYVPDVPNGENITIAELLEMRSGLYNYTNNQRRRRGGHAAAHRLHRGEPLLCRSRGRGRLHRRRPRHLDAGAHRGKVLNPEYQRIWENSIRPEVDGNRLAQYRYGISRMQWGPNVLTFHGGETAGYNSFMRTFRTSGGQYAPPPRRGDHPVGEVGV
jgi:pimeloyl-ACP methyl ester carboxylesterase